MLSAVFLADRYANHYRHLNYVAAHGLPFGQLIENFVAASSQKIAVHNLGNHTPARHSVTNGSAHNGALRNGRIEETMIGQCFRQSAIDRKSAAPISVLFAVSNERRVFVKPVDDGFKNRVAVLVAFNF